MIPEVPIQFIVFRIIFCTNKYTFSLITNSFWRSAKWLSLTSGIAMYPNPPNLTLLSVLDLNLSLGLAP